MGYILWPSTLNLYYFLGWTYLSLSSSLGQMRSTAVKSAFRLKRVRRQHNEELAEDYVEAIFKRVATGGIARIKDLQADFGVSHVSVIRGLKRLADQGLVEYSRSSGASLTAAGEKLARKAIEKHELLKNLLISIGVSPEQADADAEGAEHHLSRESMQAIRHFLAAPRS